jgi:hypothetical protein
VISVDDFDAETAAKYGCMSCLSVFTSSVLYCADDLTLKFKGINRMIPDAEFEYFVDKFARRVAGWDHYGIATAKQLINENSAFPTVSQWLETWDAFLEGQIKTTFQARYPERIKARVQTNVSFEKNILEFPLKCTPLRNARFRPDTPHQLQLRTK